MTVSAAPKAAAPLKRFHPRRQSSRHRAGLKPGQWPGAGGPIGAPMACRRVFWAVGAGRQARCDRRAAELWADHLSDRRQSAVGYLIHRAVLSGRTHVAGHGE